MAPASEQKIALQIARYLGVASDNNSSVNIWVSAYLSLGVPALQNKKVCTKMYRYKKTDEIKHRFLRKVTAILNNYLTIQFILLGNYSTSTVTEKLLLSYSLLISGDGVC